MHPLIAHKNVDGSCPTPWAAKCWSVFINDEAQLTAAIQYVQRHPQKEGLPLQSYDFLKPVI